MKVKDTFSYYKSEYMPDITLLNASICDFKYKRHAHEDFAIGVTERGYQSFYCNGQYHKVPSSGIILINPEELHDGYSETKQGYTYNILYIPKGIFKEVYREVSGYKCYDFRFKNTVLFNRNLSNQLTIFMNLMKTNQLDNLLGEEQFLNILTQLIALNNCLQVDSNSMKTDEKTVRKAKEFIASNLNRKISIDEVAKNVNISKYHFIRMFKKHTGRTPYQYTIECRIEAVRKAIEEGKDISFAVEKYGFYDQGHLNRRFKEVYGITPYRFKNFFST